MQATQPSNNTFSGSGVANMSQVSNINQTFSAQPGFRMPILPFNIMQNSLPASQAQQQTATTSMPMPSAGGVSNTSGGMDGHVPLLLANGVIVMVPPEVLTAHLQAQIMGAFQQPSPTGQVAVSPAAHLGHSLPAAGTAVSPESVQKQKGAEQDAATSSTPATAGVVKGNALPADDVGIRYSTYFVHPSAATTSDCSTERSPSAAAGKAMSSQKSLGHASSKAANKSSDASAFSVNPVDLSALLCLANTAMQEEHSPGMGGSPVSSAKEVKAKVAQIVGSNVESYITRMARALVQCRMMQTHLGIADTSMFKLIGLRTVRQWIRMFRLHKLPSEATISKMNDWYASMLPSVGSTFVPPQSDGQQPPMPAEARQGGSAWLNWTNLREYVRVASYLRSILSTHAMPGHVLGQLEEALSMGHQATGASVLVPILRGKQIPNKHQLKALCDFEKKFKESGQAQQGLFKEPKVPKSSSKKRSFRQLQLEQSSSAGSSGSDTNATITGDESSDCAEFRAKIRVETTSDDEPQAQRIRPSSAVTSGQAAQLPLSVSSSSDSNSDIAGSTMPSGSHVHFNEQFGIPNVQDMPIHSAVTFQVLRAVHAVVRTRAAQFQAGFSDRQVVKHLGIPDGLHWRQFLHGTRLPNSSLQQRMHEWAEQHGLGKGPSGARVAAPTVNWTQLPTLLQVDGMTSWPILAASLPVLDRVLFVLISAPAAASLPVRLAAHVGASLPTVCKGWLHGQETPSRANTQSLREWLAFQGQDAGLPDDQYGVCSDSSFGRRASFNGIPISAIKRRSSASFRHTGDKVSDKLLEALQVVVDARRWQSFLGMSDQTMVNSSKLSSAGQWQLLMHVQEFPDENTQSLLHAWVERMRARKKGQPSPFVLLIDNCGDIPQALSLDQQGFWPNIRDCIACLKSVTGAIEARFQASSNSNLAESETKKSGSPGSPIGMDLNAAANNSSVVTLCESLAEAADTTAQNILHLWCQGKGLPTPEQAIKLGEAVSKLSSTNSTGTSQLPKEVASAASDVNACSPQPEIAPSSCLRSLMQRMSLAVLACSDPKQDLFSKLSEHEQEQFEVAKASFQLPATSLIERIEALLDDERARNETESIEISVGSDSSPELALLMQQWSERVEVATLIDDLKAAYSSSANSAAFKRLADSLDTPASTIVDKWFVGASLPVQKQTVGAIRRWLLTYSSDGPQTCSDVSDEETASEQEIGASTSAKPVESTVSSVGTAAATSERTDVPSWATDDNCPPLHVPDYMTEGSALKRTAKATQCWAHASQVVMRLGLSENEVAAKFSVSPESWRRFVIGSKTVSSTLAEQLNKWSTEQADKLGIKLQEFDPEEIVIPSYVLETQGGVSGGWPVLRRSVQVIEKVCGILRKLSESDLKSAEQELAKELGVMRHTLLRFLRGGYVPTSPALHAMENWISRRLQG